VQEPGAQPSSATEDRDRQNGTDQADGLYLLSQHAALIEASGISPTVAVARGYRSCTTEDAALLRELGFAVQQRRFPGLLIPLYNPRGVLAGYQYRPDNPRRIQGRLVKYESIEGSTPVLDVSPTVSELRDDPNIPMFVTEGTRKADAAASHGLFCVSVAGVWSWRGTNARGGKTDLEDWGDIALNGRLTYLCFDNDVMTKPSVAKALASLKKMLEKRGATVKIVYLPEDPDI
jgi:Domain of unknown function (DUF3854)